MFVFILFFVFVSQLFAQAPDSLWSRTFGGGGLDASYAICQTTDGGFILAGQTDSFGAGLRDFYVVKTDENGFQQWSRTYGGGSYEACNDIQQTADGGYILAGYTYSFVAGGGTNDFWLLKTLANGDSTWSKTFGGSGTDHCHSVQQTSDGGYILAGHTSSFGAGNFDFWLVKTNSIGDSLWSHTFGGSNEEVCSAATLTSDGGVALCGHTRSFGAGNADVWLVRTNSEGDSLWSATYGGFSSDGGEDIVQTADDGFALISGSYPDGFQSEFRLTRTDASGNLLWEQFYDGTGGGIGNDYGHSLVALSDGGFVLAGRNELGIHEGPADFWLIRVNAMGNLIWDKTFGGPENDLCWELATTNDGGYIMVGETNSFGAGGIDFWQLKTEPDIACSIPAQPGELIIQSVGEDAFLTWSRVDTTIDSCPILVDRYLIFFSEQSDGPYYFLAFSEGPNDTTYTHAGVVTYSPSMFYQVAAWVGTSVILNQVINDADHLLTHEELTEELRLASKQ